MAASRSLFAFILLAVVLVKAVSCGDDVNYRKSPFNGSVFGKRNNGLLAEWVVGQGDRGACEVLLHACGQLLQREHHRLTTSLIVQSKDAGTFTFDLPIV